MNDTHLLAGVTVPLVTVMSAPGKPDAAAAESLIRAMAAAEVDNLMLLGSNGEGALVPPSTSREYLAEVTAAWRELRPQGRVLINVSAPGTTEVLIRAEDAVAAAPDFLIVSPPSYFWHRQDEIVAHIRSVERFGLPYAIYNVPKYANALTVEAFRVLIAESEQLIGLKDSSGDLDTVRVFLEEAKARPGIGLSQGDENALGAGIAAGAIGIVPGTANIAPRPAVELMRAALAEDLAEVARLQAFTTALTGLHKIRPGVPSIKAILNERGLAPAFTAPPLAACTAEERAALLEFLIPYEEQLVPVR